MPSQSGDSASENQPKVSRGRGLGQPDETVKQGKAPQTNRPCKKQSSAVLIRAEARTRLEELLRDRDVAREVYFYPEVELDGMMLLRSAVIDDKG